MVKPEDVPSLTPDITVSGPANAFLRLGLTQNVSQAQKLGLRIHGDMTLALSLAHAVKHPRVDFTERLSGWIGDGAAHRLQQCGVGFRQRIKKTRRTLTDITTEYLQE